MTALRGDRPPKPIAAGDRSPAEAFPRPLGPFGVGDRIWFSREVVTEDQLIHPGALSSWRPHCHLIWVRAAHEGLTGPVSFLQSLRILVWAGYCWGWA